MKKDRIGKVLFKVIKDVPRNGNALFFSCAFDGRTITDNAILCQRANASTTDHMVAILYDE